MKKCEYKFQSGPKSPVNDQIATYQYEKGEKGFPILKIIRLEYFDSKGKLERHEESVFTLSFADVPERDFTLTAFGLPEPVGVTWPKPTKWWVWISLGAAFAVGIALVLAMLGRRYFPTNSPTAGLTRTNKGLS
jgi:hypothetical protein